jgi:predicted amidohydrolase YtcJ
LRSDYADMPGTRGVAVYEYAELSELVKAVHASGRSLAVHAIGDGAIQMVLDSFEEAFKEYKPGDIRHGVVHAQITDLAMLRRFKALGVMAYVQPIFIRADSRIASARTGSIASSSYAFKTLRDMGVRTPFGTDCPVEAFDPFQNLFCAVTRKGPDGYPEGGFNAGEAVPIDEAVKAYTSDGAYASYEENIKGIIKPGYYADMAMLSRNIFDEGPEAILRAEAVTTVFNGA